MAKDKSDAILSVRNIETFYGPIMAIRGVSLDVKKGSMVTVLGANGAGKSTILKTISGIMDTQKGTVTFEGKNITNMDPARVVKRGISQVPEGREVFPLLTVAENLKMGAYLRHDRAGIHQDLEMCYDYFPVLRERAGQIAGQLSGGQQQMLAISRALMSRPRLLLLDEPSLGLAPRAARTIFEAIPEFRDQGLTVLLVEQNARAALQIADRAYVLETGSVVMEGSTQELLNQREVQRAYLGRGYRQVWEEG